MSRGSHTPPRLARAGLLLAAALLTSAGRVHGESAAAPELVAWFQKTEQVLMSAIAPGDREPWERVMDPGCVFTTEEGRVLTRDEFLAEYRPLPEGLSGEITVKELTVQELPGAAVVRFLADEKESVFGQHLETQYRITDVYRSAGKDWKLVSSHASVVTRDPPAQPVSTAGWPGLVGRYRVSPGGWELKVELRDGELFAGRSELHRLIPLAPNGFVREGSLGDWFFITDTSGRGVRIVQLRKHAPLVWDRVEGTADDSVPRGRK